MASPLECGGRRGVLITAAATVVLAALGITLMVLGLRSPEGPPTAATGATTSAGPARAENSDGPADPDFGPFLPASAPVALDIPSIDVHSPDIVDLGVQADGSIEVPSDAGDPGWFAPGPTPGQLGPAVIAGHVDSAAGPAVFYRLGQLRPGDRIEVTRADGTIATFSVDRVQTYKKQEFPTRAVYGTTTRAELRLITCSGDYDDDTGYDSNTVAFAHLV